MPSVELLPSRISRRAYNRMRDRLIDLAREYSLDDIVRLELIEGSKYSAAPDAVKKTIRWALTRTLSRAQREKAIRETIASLDVTDQFGGDFILGASEDGDDDPSCWDRLTGNDSSSDERVTETFDDVEEMARRYGELERAGKNPVHVNTHGPRAWVITHDP